MKNLFALAAVSVILAALACSYGTMRETTYDSKGKATTQNYSKYYSVGVWFVEGKLGLQVVVDHEKREVPGVYGTKQALGLLGPDDLEAVGLYTLYLWNIDQEPHEIVFTRIVGDREPLNDLVNVKQVASPSHRQKVVAGRGPISNYGKEIALALEAIVDGTPVTVKAVARRQTYEELKAHNEGKVDWPWYKEPYKASTRRLLANDQQGR